MRSRLRRSRRGERGSELIELAIVLPILLLVFAAIIDFGFLFQRFEAVTNAAREGARIGVLPIYGSSDVEARVLSYLDASGLTGAPTPTVTYPDVPLFAGGPTISVVRVEVTYPATFLYLGPIAALVGGGGHGAITLRAVSEMRRESGAGGS